MAHLSGQIIGAAGDVATARCGRKQDACTLRPPRAGTSRRRSRPWAIRNRSWPQVVTPKKRQRQPRGICGYAQFHNSMEGDMANASDRDPRMHRRAFVLGAGAFGMALGTAGGTAY